MKYNDFNYDLCYRFVKDFSYPIVVTTDAGQFFYELDFYEEEFGTRTKWEWVVYIINKDYDGNPNVFNEAYHKSRNDLILYIENLPAFQKFNTDNDIYRQWKSIQLPKSKYSTPYNGETIGKRFITVDMKKANFQALKYMGVFDDDTFDDLIARVATGSMLEYLIQSKRTRQVIFGKNNAKRHITVEKMIMNDILEKYIRPVCDGELLYFGSDELFISVPDDADVETLVSDLKDSIQFAPVECRVEFYTLSGYSLYVVHKEGKRHKIVDFYEKVYSDHTEFKGLPDEYEKIARKLLKGVPLVDRDKIIEYNKCQALLLEEFVVEKIK